MDLPQLAMKYNMDIRGVLHCGAHLAEEAPIYHAMRVTPVWWVEANPLVLPKVDQIIRLFPDQLLISALIYSKDNEYIDFNITNYDGMSSSILEFGTHPTFSPDTVFEHKIKLRTTTIDTLVADCFVEANFLNMDLQGAELHALSGGVEYLAQVDYIMTEINNEEVYQGCAKVDQLDALLTDFTRVETYWVPGQGWGDGLYVRTSLL